MTTGLLDLPPFSLPQNEKKSLMLCELIALHKHHYHNCIAYKNICDCAFPNASQSAVLTDLPYLPVDLFKHRNFKSVDQSIMRVTLRSSGTTSQTASRIQMDSFDARTTSLQLAHTMQSVIGNKRLPMLFIDSAHILRNDDGSDDYNARAAAILGLMPLGHNHTFALDDDLIVQIDVIYNFLNQYKNEPFIIYGFTYLIWSRLIDFCKTNSLDLSNAILLHSGGWKNLLESSVTPDAFRQVIMTHTGAKKVINFYGMAELPGTVFLENEYGSFAPPNHADVIIRDPYTFKPMDDGQIGLVQILHTLPRSFPAYSILTEDLGSIVATDKGQWKGKQLLLSGRLEKADMRGCSDVIAQQDREGHTA